MVIYMYVGLVILICRQLLFPFAGRMEKFSVHDVASVEYNPLHPHALAKVD